MVERVMGSLEPGGTPQHPPLATATKEKKAIMPKTKKKFADDDSPSEDEDARYDVVHHHPAGGPAGHPGGGKHLRYAAGGGGKQLSSMQRGGLGENDDSEESESDSDDDAGAVAYRGGGKQFSVAGGEQLLSGAPGGGKQFRVPSGGKQLRMPQPEQDSDEESDDEDDEGGGAAIYGPGGAGGGGKSLAGMQHRGGGKQLRMPHPEHDSDDDSDDSDEQQQQPETIRAVPRGGGKQLLGKQLRRPTAAGAGKDEQPASYEDMDIDEEVKKEKEDKDEENGAVPPPPPKAASDDDMEESSSDESESEEEEEEEEEEQEEEEELDMETFDTSKLVHGEGDRRMLESLPEFEREAILADRFEKLKNAADMKRALRENKRREREQKKLAKEQKEAKKGGGKTKKAPAKTRAAAAAAAKKKKSADASAADAALAVSLSSTRESSRNRDASGSKGKKAAALKAIREERSSKIVQREESESDLDYGDEGASDSDDDYEDEAAVSKPWLLQKRRTRLQKDVSSESSDEEEEAPPEVRPSLDGRATFVEAELEDYIKVAIPRRRLARWCNEPFFEDAVQDMYVRLAIGRDKKKMKPCYRLCQIVGVDKRAAEYKFPAIKSEKPVSTNKVLKLKFGGNVKPFCMYMVSDSKPSAEDVSLLVAQLKNNRLNHEILSKRRAFKLRKTQDELVTNYTYTREDIEMSIAAKKKRKVANIAMEKTRTSIAVQAAREAAKDAEAQLDQAKRALLEAGEDEDVTKLESSVTLATEALENAKSELEAREQEEERILSAEETRKKRIKGTEKIQNWNRVNERAKEKNKMADYESYKQQRELEKKEAASQGTPKFNPYARRKVKPKILWEVGQKTEEEAAAEGRDQSQAVADSKHVKTRVTHGHERGEASLTSRSEKENDNDKKTSDDFAIDDELLVRGSGVGVSLISDSVGSRRGDGRIRRGLSLADYQAKKQAGVL